MENDIFCTFCATNIEPDNYESHLKICFQERDCEICKEPFLNHNFKQTYSDHLYTKHSIRQLSKMKDQNYNNYKYILSVYKYQEFYNEIENDTLNYFAQCKLCQNIVHNSFQHRKAHITYFHRGLYFSDYHLLFENTFSTYLKGDYCICNVCGIVIEDVFIFILYHLYNTHYYQLNSEFSLIPEVFCNLCNEITSIKSHNHMSYMTMAKKKLPILDTLNHNKEITLKNVSLNIEENNNSLVKSKSTNPKNYIDLTEDYEIKEASFSKANSTIIKKEKDSIFGIDDYLYDYELPAFIKSISKDEKDDWEHNKDKDRKNNNISINNDNTFLNNNFQKTKPVSIISFNDQKEDSQVLNKKSEKILESKHVFGNYINPWSINIDDLLNHFNQHSTKKKEILDTSLNELCKKEFEPLKLLYVDIIGTMNHYFKNREPTQNKSLIAKIKDQLVIFQNSLPCNYFESYFLRVDKNYIQFMKLLIAGERGTPFEHGLYEFDIFIPEEYPDLKPLVICITTLRKNITFSPSLNKSGLVIYTHQLHKTLDLFNNPIDNLWYYGINISEESNTLINCFIMIQKIVLGEKILDITEEIDKKFYFIYEVYENEGYCNIIRYLNLKYAIICAIQSSHNAFIDVIEVYFKVKKQGLIEDITYWITRAEKTGYSFKSDLLEKYNKDLMLNFLTSEEVYTEEVKKLINELKSLIY